MPTPPTPDPEPAQVGPIVRPGDLILIRAIKFWDSGQIQRVFVGLVLTALPLVYDLFQKNALTWRSGISVVIGAILAWIGVSRAKAPDIASVGIKALDKSAAQAVVPPKLAAALAVANVRPAGD